MKPHPRIRKTIKWGGAAATVLLLAVWIASGWWRIFLSGPGGATLRFWPGAFGVGRVANVAPSPGIQYGRVDDMPYQWWFARYHDLAGSWTISIPFWFPFLLCLGMTVIAWRRDALIHRRERLGLCPKCNYDRTGLAPGVVCPECGSAAAHP